jgi:hypothetical protein
MTPERVNEIFKEMDVYVLELGSDSKDLGPQYFQERISICRNYLNKVSIVVNEINRERLIVSDQLRKFEALYDLDYDAKLVTDDQIKSLSNVEDRKAAVGYSLRDQKSKINDLKAQMHSLDSVYKVVSYRNRELHATMSAIKDQRRLIQIDVSTGAFYGDERIPRSTDGMALEGEGFEEDLSKILAGDSPSSEKESILVSEESVVLPTVESNCVSVEERVVTEKDVLNFLNGKEGFSGDKLVDTLPVVEEFSLDVKKDKDFEETLSFLENLDLV